jgi:hypothetical protein
MSNHFDELLTVAEYKKKLASIEKELKATYKTIDKLLKDNKLKEEEIGQLKSLLEKSVPVLIEDKKPQQLIQINLSAEEEIAEIQLNKLKESSKNRALTLEEARIYDLLVKNKRLSRKESTINIDNANYRDVSEKELMQIAGRPDDSGSDK